MKVKIKSVDHTLDVLDFDALFPAPHDKDGDMLRSSASAGSMLDAILKSRQRFSIGFPSNPTFRGYVFDSELNHYVSVSESEYRAS